MFDQQAPNEDFAIQQIKMTALDMSGWLKFLGIVSIVSGAFMALTIVGIIVAWIPIWSGILLYSAGNKAKDAHYMNNTLYIAEMMRKLKTYFILNGVLLIIAIIGFVIMIATVGLAFFSAFRRFDSY